ncbi:PadR family transcriptional regulator [Clostridium sp.]|uniref:PadR family transcriptional regulator n=1 Tax=Clostridium sp. TaxID=1506 RepID=UPI003D6D4C92
MDKLFKTFLPMTETAYYILLSLTEPRHGYAIIQHVDDITNGKIKLGSGTVYGTLTKFQNKGVISIFSDEKRRTIYEITEIGKKLILAEIERIKEIYENAIRFEGDFYE